MNDYGLALSNDTEVVRKCLAAAVLAPSGDNMQPWRFEIDAAGRISVLIDETRDRSPMNSGQTMARLACGAAVENILIEAEANGWEAKLEEGVGCCVASVWIFHATNAITTPSCRQQLAIHNRKTNRRIYAGLPLNIATLAELKASTPVVAGASTHWLACRDQINAMADLIGRADEIMFSESSMRKAFLCNIRFDRTAVERVDEGLSLASLELSSSDRFALHAMRYIPNTVLKLSGGMRLFANHARKLVRSASGLCLIAAPDSNDRSFFRAGRAMQRAWLALTEHGFAVQPMMSLMVLANALEQGTPELIASLVGDRIEKLLEQFCSLLPGSVAGQRPLFLMRFGVGAAPSGRTGRLTPSINFRAE